jgi:hypothetical protein
MFVEGFACYYEFIGGDDQTKMKTLQDAKTREEIYFSLISNHRKELQMIIKR